MEVDQLDEQIDEQMDESSCSSDSSGSSSSSSSDQVDYEFFERFKHNASEIRAKVSLNPYNYDAHIELIKFYEDAKTKIEFNKDLYGELRGARELMYEYYPLAPNLWCSWLNDEMNYEQDSLKVLEYFEKAVRDYCSGKSRDFFYLLR